MINTARVLLGKYKHDELVQLVDLLHEFKGRYAKLAGEMIVAAHERGLDEDIVCASITAECLLLAAAMYAGEPVEFLIAADNALFDAKREMPLAETGTQ